MVGVDTRLRRFFFAAALAVSGAPGLQAQPRQRPPAQYAQINPPDQAEGAEILSRLRDIGLAGPYYLEFELRVMPRAGDERRLAGRWFGSRNVSGPVTRIELSPTPESTSVWLVQSGPAASVWRASGSGFAAVEGEAAMQPLEGTNLSATDLQTPFMSWTDFVYEGLARFRGRPTWVFLLYPPAATGGNFPGIGGARVWVDTQYNGLSQVQWVDAGGQPLKTITVLQFGRIGERWIVESFDVRDERTRDKTRFQVTAAALDLDLPGELFTPAGSTKPVGIERPPGSLVQVK